MRLSTKGLTAALLAVMLTMTGSLSAQVVEERESEANPAVSIFQATLFGAGTGLLLGGAYALVEDSPDHSTGDALKWGVAGGAAAGAVVGLIYVATRAGPEGSVEEISALRIEDGAWDVDAVGILPHRRPARDLLSSPTYELNLVRVGF